MAMMVQIKWGVNPFRGDAFEEGWRAAAEAVLDYGATSWAFYRAQDGLLDFVQEADLPDEGRLRALLVLTGDQPRAGAAVRLLPGAAPADVLERRSGSGALSPVAD